MQGLPAHLRLRIPTIRRFPTAKVDRSTGRNDRFERDRAACSRGAIDCFARSDGCGIKGLCDASNILLTHERWRHDRDYLPARFDQEAGNLRLTAKRVEGS